MANSLRAKIKKLKHDGHIDSAICEDLLLKLEGHDREIRAKAIDELMEVVKTTYHNFCGYDLEKMTKYGNEDAIQLGQSYSTLFMYEIAGEFDDLIDALEQLKVGVK